MIPAIPSNSDLSLMAQGEGSGFDPANDPIGFRSALGSFVTGVTLVTTQTPSGPVGIIANSFASVSLDPPLVLWSPAKKSARFADFASAQQFTIHVLGAAQRDLCAAVIASKHAVRDLPSTGAVDATVAHFECTLSASHDAGDHVIVVGRVIRAHHNGGTPLVFANGVYGQFNPVAG